MGIYLLTLVIVVPLCLSFFIRIVFVVTRKCVKKKRSSRQGKFEVCSKGYEILSKDPDN